MHPQYDPTYGFGSLLSWTNMYRDQFPVVQQTYFQSYLGGESHAGAMVLILILHTSSQIFSIVSVTR